jgi:hypothetical protein
MNHNTKAFEPRAHESADRAENMSNDDEYGIKQLLAGQNALASIDNVFLRTLKELHNA